MSEKVEVKTKVEIKFEFEEEEKEFKASHKLINEFKALAKLQKAQSSAKGLAEILGNNGLDVPKPTAEQCEINRLADEFEFDIEEE